MNGLEIAVIGMSCRFPNASNPDELWRVLSEGQECVQQFSEQELLDTGVPDYIVKKMSFIKSKAALLNADAFDGDFFDYRASECLAIEPQERILY